jgi:hypothetical protein
MLSSSEYLHLIKLISSNCMEKLIRRKELRFIISLKSSLMRRKDNIKSFSRQIWLPEALTSQMLTGLFSMTLLKIAISSFIELGELQEQEGVANL